MNRRKVLQNIGLGTGFLVISPSLLNLLQSCKSDHKEVWKTLFFSASNGYALTQILEVILPKSDTAGATDLDLAAFLDRYFEEVLAPKDQAEIKKGADAMALNFKEMFNKEISDGAPSEFKKLVAHYLGAEKTQRDEYVKRLSAKQEPEISTPTIDTQAATYGYLTHIRDLGIWAWKTSEEIGENVLWYDPIPGAQKGCLSLEEAGNGKAMSL